LQPFTAAKYISGLRGDAAIDVTIATVQDSRFLTRVTEVVKIFHEHTANLDGGVEQVSVDDVALVGISAYYQQLGLRSNAGQDRRESRAEGTETATGQQLA
jgi:hypothetical protein